MITKTNGAAIYGVDANIISIEVNIVQGTNLYMVGLPDNAIKESQHRIESVLKYIKCEMPRQRVIVNLAPADVKKEGASYDLPIALAILQASHQKPLLNLDKYVILGELSLDGFLRPIKGVLPIAVAAKRSGITGFILPKDNASEAAIVNGIDVFPVNHINDAIDFSKVFDSGYVIVKKGSFAYSDTDDEKPAGGHNLIMIGSPGAGKTMLAKRISSILPPLTLNEALETTKIYSVVGKLHAGNLMTSRPFRAPHHTINDVALIGGGTIPQPGEISLAHNGVLFLDELPEFMRSVLEVMRQPLEERKVTISRTKMSVDFPANFMLIASMNPCPCGYYNHPTKSCVCPNGTIQKYLNKVSGPLLDRIDLHIQVTPVSFDSISAKRRGESSRTIQERVITARQIQLRRFEKFDSVYTNSMMPSNMVKDMCEVSSAGNLLIKNAMERGGILSAIHNKLTG